MRPIACCVAVLLSLCGLPQTTSLRAQTAAAPTVEHDLSTPSDPQALDPGFWAPGWSWNDYPCEMPTDAATSLRRRGKSGICQWARSA